MQRRESRTIVVGVMFAVTAVLATPVLAGAQSTLITRDRLQKKPGPAQPGAPAASTAHAGGIPARPAPRGFTSTDDPQGGRALLGAVGGGSASAMLRQTLQLMRGYFDGLPRVSAAVGDPGDARMLAFFDSRLSGVALRGAAIVDTSSGASTVAVVFDLPARAAQTFRRMGKRLGQPAAQSAGSRDADLRSAVTARPVALSYQMTPDGKARVGLPPGWKISGWGNAAVDVAGPGGEEAHLGIYLPIFRSTGWGSPVPGAVYLPFIADPVAATQAVTQYQARQGSATTNLRVLDAVPTAPPTGAGAAAFLFASSTTNGRPYYHYALVNTAPIDELSWAFYYSAVAAPQSSFRQQFSTLLQVWKSWSLNPQVIADRLADAALKMRQAGEILREAARGQRDAYDRANKGWSYYIREIEVLEESGSNTRWTLDRDLASLIVKNDPVNFRLVPPSQYLPVD